MRPTFKNTHPHKVAELKERQTQKKGKSNYLRLFKICLPAYLWRYAFRCKPCLIQMIRNWLGGKWIIMYRAVEICWQSILLSAKWPSPHFWKIKVAPYQVLTAMEIKCSSSLTNMEIMEISNFVQRKHIHFTRTQKKGSTYKLKKP